MSPNQPTDRDDALRWRYARLLRATRAVVEDCKPAGDGEPLCGVSPHLIRRLRRELSGEPQATAMWISPS